MNIEMFRVKFNGIPAALVRSIWVFMENMGIDDADVDLLTPAIQDRFDELKSKKQSNEAIKSNLKTLIESEVKRLNLTLLKHPVSVINPVTEEQLMLDSLATYLAEGEESVPCFAVTIHNSKLVIAFNSPLDEQKNYGDVKLIVEKKLAATKFAALTPVVIFPNQYDDERNADGKYHAEQLLALYLFLNTDKDVKDEKHYIGISKLCCAACEKVLSNMGILHRGAHGMTFPRVIDIQTGMRARYAERTKLIPVPNTGTLSMHGLFTRKDDTCVSTIAPVGVPAPSY